MVRLFGYTNREAIEIGDAMFQFYDGNNVIADTGLIELSDAIEMFDSNKDAFSAAIERGLETQMAVWGECSSDTDYHCSIKMWDSSCIKVIDGEIWVKGD
ncbi:MAG: hypothetical protein RR390_00435 [Hafnia sp.]